MPHWYALTSNGDMVSLGEHKDFDAASDYCDSHPHRECVWIADAEQARTWISDLSAALKENKELT